MRYICLLLLACITSLTAQAQSEWDYPRYPTTDFDFTKLEFKLEIIPSENIVKGNAVYHAKALLSDINTMLLNTRESSIESVSMGDQSLDFEVRGDSLIISLSDSVNRGDELSIELTWQSESIFGYHNDNGYIWSSSVPKSQRHWLPGFDHPRNDLIVEATYSVPEEYSVIGNGDLISDEILVN